MWVYKHGGSRNPREQHLAWDGMALPADHPFWKTYYPPADNIYNCSCYVVGARNEKGAQHLGADLTKTLPDDWTPPTGSTGYPLGERVTEVVSALAKKLEKYPGPIANDLLSNMTSNNAFTDWFAKPTEKSMWPVGILSTLHAQRIGAQTTVVNLSAETVKKQIREHPEVQPAEYRNIQTAIQEGWVVQDSANTLIYVLESEGYVSVVKSTKTGKGLFITSFRRLSSQQAKRDEELKRLRRKENKE